MKRTKIKDLLTTSPAGQTVKVEGWVRTFRNNQFVSINDGSTIQNLQAVVELNSIDESLLKRITTGACISVEGELIASLGKGQAVEVKAKVLTILGDCDAEAFPLQLKNRPSLEYLREIAHLRSTFILLLLPDRMLKVPVPCSALLRWMPISLLSMNKVTSTTKRTFLAKKQTSQFRGSWKEKPMHLP
jgi:OB-fold nucleic acid binding domain